MGVVAIQIYIKKKTAMSFCELVLARANLQTCLQMLPVAHINGKSINLGPDRRLQVPLHNVSLTSHSRLT